MADVKVKEGDFTRIDTDAMDMARSIEEVVKKLPDVTLNIGNVVTALKEKHKIKTNEELLADIIDPNVMKFVIDKEVHRKLLKLQVKEHEKAGSEWYQLYRVYVEQIHDLFKYVEEFIRNRVVDMYTSLDRMYNFVISLVNGVISGVKKTYTAIATRLTQLYHDISQLIQTAWKTVKGWFESEKKKSAGGVKPGEEIKPEATNQQVAMAPAAGSQQFISAIFKNANLYKKAILEADADSGSLDWYVGKAKKTLVVFAFGLLLIVATYFVYLGLNKLTTSYIGLGANVTAGIAAIMESVNKTVSKITLEADAAVDAFETVVNVILWPFKAVIQKVSEALAAVSEAVGGITLPKVILIIGVFAGLVFSILGAFSLAVTIALAARHKIEAIV